MRVLNRILSAALLPLALGACGEGSFIEPGSLVPTIATAHVDITHPTTIVPPGFLGFSHEWGQAQTLMGPASAANPIYRQLLENLSAFGNGPVQIRVGGNSTDTTGVAQSTDVDPFAQLARDLGAPFVLGVNLGKNDLTLATEQAATYIPQMPTNSLVAIEIGNEPDLYSANGDRSASYGYSDYASEFARWRAAIAPLLPAGSGVLGPSWSLSSELVNLPAFVAQEKGSLAFVSQHLYAGTVCGGHVNPPDYLLRDSSAKDGPAALAASVPIATAAGLAFRVGEMNSISCSGQAGLSDTFSSALWATDILFELANVGISGVNFHVNNGGAYSAFVFDITGSGAQTSYAIQSIRPLYYGLLFFQQATPKGSRLLPVTLSSAANIKAWATVDASGVVRVALLDKDLRASGNVRLTLSSLGAASVTRMRAPNYLATSGLSIGGLTFDGSRDGTPVGTPASETIAPRNGGYDIAMSPASAALITIPPN